jgi:carboxypeptidase C (cathepsin A)
LIGTSYGTLRAAGLADALANQGIYLNGIALISTAFDYHFLVPQRDLPFSNWLTIPSFAAAAWYHKKTMQDKTLEEVLDYARRFIYEEYAPVMLQPSRLNPVEKLNFHQNFANLIGLPLETVRRFEGRIDENIFTTEFFAEGRKVLGGIDARYVGDISSLASEYQEDPSYRDLRPAFYPTFLNYLQTELETETHLKYIPFSSEAFYFWDWSTFDSDNLPNFLQRLRRSLVTNPYMKVFIGSGYYDLRTPFAAMEYSLDHLELPASYRDNFQIEYYPAGHGFFFHLPSLQKLKQDMRKFYVD